MKEIDKYIGKIHNADCLEFMKQLPDKCIDLVLTDPPYGTTACKWDSIIPFDEMWKRLYNITKEHSPIVLFSAQPFTTKLISSSFDNFKYQLIWKKNVPTGLNQAKYRPMRYHEEILVFNTDKYSTYNPIMKERVGVHKECYNYDHYCGDNNHMAMNKIKRRYDPSFVQPSSILEFNVVPNRKGKLHPTQKPVELLEYLIKTYTLEKETVLDFTSGSGSLAIACLNTGRNFICIEKDKYYYEASVKRLEEAQKQLKLF